MKAKRKKDIQKMTPNLTSDELPNSPKMKRLAAQLEKYAKQVCMWKEQRSVHVEEEPKEGNDPENEFSDPSE